MAHPVAGCYVFFFRFAVGNSFHMFPLQKHSICNMLIHVVRQLLVGVGAYLLVIVPFTTACNGCFLVCLFCTRVRLMVIGTTLDFFPSSFSWQGKLLRFDAILLYINFAIDII